MDELLLMLLVLILWRSRTCFCQFTFQRSQCGDTTYIPNSAYQSNIKTVVNYLSSDTRITDGFYNLTAGHEPDRVNSLAICRGDVPVGTCRACISDSANLLPQICPNQKEAFGYSEYCSIFISNRSIYGHVQDTPKWYLGENNVSDPVAFKRSVYSLIGILQNQAANSTDNLKYAVGHVNLTGGGVLYGLVQCTPDLSKHNCIQCIQGSLDLLKSCCNHPFSTDSAVRLIQPSCFVRYETSLFYGNVPNLVPPLPPPVAVNTSVASTPVFVVVTRKRSNNASVIAISTSTGVATLILVVGIFFFLRRRKLRKSWLKYNKDEIDTLESLRFGVGAIKHATQGFSESNKLGQGGFGAVYKGVFPDGQEIAVKRLLRSTLRGEGDGQSKNEILILAKLQHRNLVRLLGYCMHKGELLLVYELVQNRSLDKFLFDPLQRQPMVWETRYRIISGICRGLLYLHEESRLRIIHRDLKAANVLLDTEFNPKIADFGMARMFSIHQTQAVASKIVGTFGYMPPEYVFQGQVSMKLDVYSFGVLLLEIVTGQRISKFLDAGENPEDLLSFAWKCWRDGTTWNIVDPAISTRIESESNDLFIKSSRTEILRCIHIGLLCVQDNPADRPTMSSIALMLQSTSLSLPVPRQPALFVEHTLTPSNVTSAKCSLNLVSVTELHPR